ncbi:unnamed protein product [Brassica oleracea]
MLKIIKRVFYLDAPNELQFDNGLGDQKHKLENAVVRMVWYVNRHTQMEVCYICQLGDVKLEAGQCWRATKLLSIS